MPSLKYIQMLLEEFKPLDQYAFADDRKDVPDETDNELEVDLYIDLERHFNEFDELDGDSIALIKKILMNGKYRDIFKIPKSDVPLYRGTKLTRDELENMLGYELDGDDLKSGKETEIFYIYKPHGKDIGSSWTNNKNTAASFSSTGTGTLKKGEIYNVILTAHPDKNLYNFISGPNGLYKVGSFSDYEDEEEMIALGPVGISGLEWKKR